MSEKEYISKETFDAEISRAKVAEEYTNKRIDDLKDFVSWGVAILGITFVMIQIGVGFLLYVLAN